MRAGPGGATVPGPPQAPLARSDRDGSAEQLHPTVNAPASLTDAEPIRPLRQHGKGPWGPGPPPGPPERLATLRGGRTTLPRWGRVDGRPRGTLRGRVRSPRMRAG